MVVVAVVSGTTNAEQVVVEAARRADERGTTVHVTYVFGLNWFRELGLNLSDMFGLPTGNDRIEEHCERKAEHIADPILEEYEAVCLVGRPIEELVRHVRAVDADCVVIARDTNWGIGLRSLYRDPSKQLRENGVSVVTVA